MCCGERGILFAAMHRVKLRCSAIDLKMENVGPVVMAGEIVPQLHGDPELEIALRQPRSRRSAAQSASV